MLPVHTLGAAQSVACVGIVHDVRQALLPVLQLKPAGAGAGRRGLAGPRAVATAAAAPASRPCCSCRRRRWCRSRTSGSRPSRRRCRRCHTCDRRPPRTARRRRELVPGRHQRADAHLAGQVAGLAGAAAIAVAAHALRARRRVALVADRRTSRRPASCRTRFRCTSWAAGSRPLTWRPCTSSCTRERRRTWKGSQRLVADRRRSARGRRTGAAASGPSCRPGKIRRHTECRRYSLRQAPAPSQVPSFPQPATAVVRQRFITSGWPAGMFEQVPSVGPGSAHDLHTAAGAAAASSTRPARRSRTRTSPAAAHVVPYPLEHARAAACTRPAPRSPAADRGWGAAGLCRRRPRRRTRTTRGRSTWSRSGKCRRRRRSAVASASRPCTTRPRTGCRAGSCGRRPGRRTCRPALHVDARSVGHWFSGSMPAETLLALARAAHEVARLAQAGAQHVAAHALRAHVRAALGAQRAHRAQRLLAAAAGGAGVPCRAVGVAVGGPSRPTGTRRRRRIDRDRRSAWSRLRTYRCRCQRAASVWVATRAWFCCLHTVPSGCRRQ